MMFAFLPLFLFIAIVGVLLGSYLLYWYRGFERAEIRLIDLQVLASDCGAEFARFPHRFATKVRTHHLGLGWNTAELKNVLKFDRPEFNSYLFDYKLFEKTPASPAGNFSGLLVEFKNQTFPTFRITSREYLKWGSYAHIPSSRLPSWLPSNLSVVAHADIQAEVIEFIHRNLILEVLISDPHFVKAFFNDEFAAFYLDGLYSPQPAKFEQLLLRLEGLGSLHGKAGWPERLGPPADAEASLAIRLLKAETN